MDEGAHGPLRVCQKTRARATTPCAKRAQTRVFGFWKFGMFRAVRANATRARRELWAQHSAHIRAWVPPYAAARARKRAEKRAKGNSRSMGTQIKHCAHRARATRGECALLDSVRGRMCEGPRTVACAKERTHGAHRTHTDHHRVQIRRKSTKRNAPRANATRNERALWHREG